MVLCIKFQMSWAVSSLSVSHMHFIGSLLAGTDHFCREGKEEDDVVFLAVGDSGKRDQI